ncbi:MAG: uroporphyrinogen decarboxylase family protein [Armatimonadota bacterium]|nr:uroporphyrinogen decarboxylase family protein [Armatimonadota bacterium]
MNSLERILAAVGFEKTDRVPVIPQIFGHAAALCGMRLREYLQDGELLARCQLKALEHYGHDAVFALMDVGVETEEIGSSLQYSDDAYPYVKSFVLSNIGGLDSLSSPDPAKSGRMPELLKANSILRKEVGDTALVVGCALGPATLAIQLVGIENALYLAADDPEAYSRVLDFAANVCITFGTAQIEAGAHLPMLFDPSASPAVVPPGFYRRHILPRHQQVFSAFKQAGAVANWLHIAGPAVGILRFYPEAGVDIANLDFCVSPSEAISRLPRTCLDGNIKPLSFVIDEPDAIAAESARLIDAFRDRGGFILSSGCEIPPDARPENISAMVQATRR